MNGARFTLAVLIAVLYLAVVAAAAFHNSALIGLAQTITPPAVVALGWLFGKGIRDQLVRGKTDERE